MTKGGKKYNAEMAYSEGFRKRAAEYIEEGHSEKELKVAFKVSPSTVHMYLDSRYIDYRKTNSEVRLCVDSI